MVRYIQSEWLKTKSLGIIKQNILFVFFAGLIAIGYSFVSLNTDAVASLFNWLCLLLINLLIPINVHIIYNHEKRSTDFKNLQVPKNNRSYEWFSKVFVLTVYYAIFLIIYGGLTLVTNLLLPYASSNLIYLSILLIFVTSWWQIPFVLFLERKSHFFLTLVINFVFGTFLTVFFGDSSFYKVVPWTWASRAIMTTMHVSINGTVISQKDPIILNTSIGYLIIASVILGVLLSVFCIDRRSIKNEKKYSINKS